MYLTLIIRVYLSTQRAVLQLLLQPLQVPSGLLLLFRCDRNLSAGTWATVARDVAMKGVLNGPAECLHFLPRAQGPESLVGCPVTLEVLQQLPAREDMPKQ